MVAVVMVGASACRKEKLREVDYKVGCASCDITFLNNDETTEVRTTQGPWTYTMRVPEGRYVSLTAVSTDSLGGVTAWIRVDGSLFATQTSNDTFAVASVNGVVP